MTGGRTRRPDLPTVLIVEDDPALRQFLRIALGSDFTLEETADGSAVLELARRLRPDLVLLDVMLPGRGGLDVLRDLRADPDLSDARVLVMTAFSNFAPADSELAGADAFLAKPFDALELLKTVKGLLGPDR